MKYRQEIFGYGGIAVPDIGIEMLNQLACLYMDELDAKDDRNTCLVDADVGAGQFAFDIQ